MQEVKLNTNPLSFEEAKELAVKLRSSGQEYPTIARVLKDRGYVSAKTKKPVGQMAVWRMVNEQPVQVKCDLPTFETYERAATYSKELREAGHSYETIARILKAHGYVSTRTGRPVTFGGVQSMVQRLENQAKQRHCAPKMAKKRKPAAVNKQSGKTETTKTIRAIHQIAGLTHLDALTRLDMIANLTAYEGAA